jgi:hypothetical protein
MAEAVAENLWVAMTNRWGFPMRLRIETFAQPDRGPPVVDPAESAPVPAQTNAAELPAAEGEGEFIGSTAAVQSS